MCSGVSIFLSKAKVNDIHLKRRKFEKDTSITGDDRKKNKVEENQQLSTYLIAVQKKKHILDLHASLNPWGSCLAWCRDVKMIWNEQIQLDLAAYGSRHLKKISGSK